MTGPFTIPPSWRWAAFGDVAWVASNLVSPLEYPTLPHIAPNHIEPETGRLLPYGTAAEDGVISPKHLFKSGHIIYSKIRPYLAKAVHVNFAGVCSADMYPIETWIDSRYLFWWLLTPSFTELAARHQSRVVLPKINKDALRILPVPVPPLAEQHRIVAVLEGHLSHLDAARVEVDRAGQRLKSLAKRVFVEAVPIPGPDHWKLASVADAGRVELGRARHPDWHTGPHMRPYLRVANVFEDRIDASDLMEMDFPPDVFARYKLMKEDILLNEGQSPGYLGRPAMYRGIPENAAFTNSLIRFRAGCDVLPEWALLVFRRHMHAGRFIREVRITTNIAHLSATRLKRVEFPIPPLDEQEQIVTKVREEHDSIQSFAGAVADCMKRVQGLRRSLLVAAFSGRLAEQDRADEPASVLLERVRLNRSGVGGAGRHAKD